MPDKEFRLPDLGEGLTDAELVAWSVAVGDEVALNQTIAEVETAKAMVELPSPFAGTVTALLAQPGETVAVGAALIRIATAGAAPEVTDAGPVRQAVLVGYGPAESAAPSRRRVPRAAPLPAGRTDGDRVSAKPMARKLARELGVDIAELAGDHPVTLAQVRAAAAAGSRRETRAPASPIRKRTAAAMTASAHTIPQVSAFRTTEVTASLALVEKLRASALFSDVKVTPLALVARIVLLALRAEPLLNARWDPDTDEIVSPGHVNLGIAVATERGLLVPVIKDADELDFAALCAGLATAASTARDGSALPASLTGATFTISNVGALGMDAGTPLVPPGTSAILGVGAIRVQPMAIDGELVARPGLTLSLSFDHRLIDGADAARFLGCVADTLTEPGLALVRL